MTIKITHYKANDCVKVCEVYNELPKRVRQQITMTKFVELFMELHKLGVINNKVMRLAKYENDNSDS